MDNRKPTGKTQRITRKGTSAPRRARKSPLAEDAAAEIAASPPPSAAAPPEVAPPPPALAPPPVILIEPRMIAGEDEPTTRVVFRARTVEMTRPMGWLLVRSILVRLRGELESRSAPVRVQFVRRFPRLAGGVGRLLTRFGW